MNLDQLAKALGLSPDDVVRISNLFAKDREAWTAFCKLVNWLNFHGREHTTEEATKLLEN